MTVPLYLRALGFLELSLGDAAAAERHLSAHGRARGQLRDPRAGRLSRSRRPDRGPDRHGRARPGRSAARRARGAGPKRAGSPWSLATGARCRGLLLAAHGSLDAAERSFEDALAEHERLPMPFELGRTLLALGLLQRRQERAASCPGDARAGTRDLRGARCAALGCAGPTRAAPARRTPDEPHDADACRAARRRVGSERSDQPPGGRQRSSSARRRSSRPWRAPTASSQIRSRAELGAHVRRRGGPAARIARAPEQRARRLSRETPGARRRDIAPSVSAMRIDRSEGTHGDRASWPSASGPVLHREGRGAGR